MKLVFVIPEYREDTSDHFYHLYQAIEKLAEINSVFVIAEAGIAPIKLKNIVGYKVQSTEDNPLYRVLQRWFWFCQLRLKGYQTFYCHYCQISTLLLWPLVVLTNAVSFKWHCSQQHYYLKRWQLSNLLAKITQDLPTVLSLKLASYLVTCTPQMKKYYQDKFKISSKRICVIPNYLCLKEQSRNLISKNQNSDYLQLLFVHRLVKRKGADRLLKYAQVIKNRKLKMKIVVVGDGPQFKQLQTGIEVENLNGVIKLIGRVEHQQIGDYYRSADFLLMPSRQEEFGRVQLEAMKFGLPILATRTISADFVLNRLQRQLVVAQKDYLDLLDLAVKIKADSNRYQSLVKAGKNQVKNFSLKQAVSNYQAMFIQYGKA